ncbi:hypothetical protein [Paenibacillus xylaniclasticus]|uniref:hypothetical protein n=1 Tax=Paenibacillus xylaniclasticus TaxID=588083 RepID=UPI0017699FE7|nr:MULTISPECIES: hypothetical protein [Paenibacillus]GFN32478.1 hypothetical protein PCURB6_27380 [Paenibacillus curdlanolyticus]
MELTEEFNLMKNLNRIRGAFPNAFINMNFELILEPKNNIYFRLEDIVSNLDFNCKVVSWVSRPSCKGLSPKWQKVVRAGFNKLLGTDFDEEQMHVIYTYLGNDCNRKLCKEFVIAGYDLSLLGGR